MAAMRSNSRLTVVGSGIGRFTHIPSLHRSPLPDRRQREDADSNQRHREPHEDSHAFFGRRSTSTCDFSDNTLVISSAIPSVALAPIDLIAAQRPVERVA